MNKFRVILSGGGTGGHIFPALSIAQGLKVKHPNTVFLFVGALGKMEMEKVPNAGFKITWTLDLWISEKAVVKKYFISNKAVH
jgi:UDP-N-acetylglucosamine--N-acetylmuramyl-(pentapeptide) pyrophosphoryl-undecaprenol N-acetylglucosamine transferase